MRRHPLVWAVPVMVLLVIVAMPFNGAFYEEFVNYDPQGDDQQWEWNHTTYVYQHTSGMLLGHLLSLVLGALLARRLRRPAVVAVPLAIALAAVTLAVAFLLAGRPRTAGFTLPWGVVLVEAAAYPLYAAVGIGLARLLPWWKPGVIVVAVAGGILWVIVTVAGLMNTGPAWLLLALPPFAAASALGSATFARDINNPSGLPTDWGGPASIALLAVLTVHALALHLLRSDAHRQETPDQRTH